MTVNGGSADRAGEYFHREIAVANGSGPVWQSVTNISGVFSNQGGLLVPASSQALAYDADGNLTADGIWTYQWDGENRLISMAMTNNVQGIAYSNVLRLDFTYDYMGRRVQKVVSSWNGTGFTPQTTSLFVYDGWNLLAVVNAQTAIQQSFMWGSDLSGTVTEAGGVGGLLMENISSTNCFVTYDGNGDITSLVNSADKSLVARYEYSPYGELLRETGLFSHLSLIKFSTKFWDVETKLVYYGGRYYSPIIGKWLGRDPTTDQIYLNLYLFCHNNPVNRFDYDGRSDGTLGELMLTRTISGSISGLETGVVDGLFGKLRGQGFWESAVEGYAKGFAAGFIGGGAALAVQRLCDKEFLGTVIGSGVASAVNDEFHGRNVNSGMRLFTAFSSGALQWAAGDAIGDAIVGCSGSAVKPGSLAGRLVKAGCDVDQITTDAGIAAAATIGIGGADLIMNMFEYVDNSGGNQ